MKINNCLNNLNELNNFLLYSNGFTKILQFMDKGAELEQSSLLEIESVNFLLAPIHIAKFHD